MPDAETLKAIYLAIAVLTAVGICGAHLWAALTAREVEDDPDGDVGGWG